MTFQSTVGTLVLLASVGLGGCASGGGYYDDGYGYQDRRGFQQEYCSNCGTIVGIERAAVRDNRLGGGTVLGAVIGGALGNQVGKGDGRAAATIAGAVIGGAVGHDVEKDGRRTQRGLMISARMQDGGVQRFMQSDAYGLRQGDRVVIVNGQVQADRR